MQRFRRQQQKRHSAIASIANTPFIAFIVLYTTVIATYYTISLPRERPRPYPFSYHFDPFYPLHRFALSLSAVELVAHAIAAI